MIDHFDLPLGSKGQFPSQIEQTAKEPTMSSFSAGFASSRLDEGKLGFYETVEAKSRADIVKAFPDYKDNQEAYDAYLGIDESRLLGVFTPSKDMLDIHRKKYTNAIKDDIYRLDENNNVVEGSGYNVFANVLFDQATMRGFLLAQKNGMSDNLLQSKYQETVKTRQKELEQAEKGMWGNIGGALTGYLASPETLADFASPSKIMASTIGKGFVKAFGVEASYVAAGETMREMKRRDHSYFMEENRSLWDGTKEILINSGFAGLIRGIGSAVWDAKTMRDIHNRVGQFEGADDALTDKQIFTQFAKRENFRLHTNSNAHDRILDDVELQMEQGKEVDISSATDIPIESKITSEDTINFIDELDSNPDVVKDKEFYQSIDDQIDQAEIDLDFIDEDIVKQYENDARLLEDEETKQILKQIEELEKVEDGNTSI